MMAAAMGAEKQTEGSIGTGVIGAGPAGLTAGHVLAGRGAPATVFEADGIVGGIAKTVEFRGYRFDLGGHRFYTKLAPVQRMWERVLGEEFLERERLSRIYYRQRFFDYPLTASDVFGGLGPVESARCALSYVWAQWRFRNLEPDTFEEWVVSRFGRRIYDDFFRSYTLKVWGIPGSEIRSEWAAQRIQSFNLWQAVLGILNLRREHAQTLIESFHYPRLGPGQLWERLADQITGAGVPVRLNHRVEAVMHEGSRVTGMCVSEGGTEREVAVDSLISTMPLSDLVLALEPRAPADVRDAAELLRYRNLCLVALILDEDAPFPDNWIYLHDSAVTAGRVQNFGAWSPDMVQPGAGCLGVEYFCFPEDDIWKMDDADAVRLATDELASIGLIDPARVVDGVKVAVPRAYPMYDAQYREAVAELRGYLESFDNLQTCGRNGLHRYNNQDHSMWTAVLAALNLLDGSEHDVWGVNVGDEYLEEADVVESELGAEIAQPFQPD